MNESKPNTYLHGSKLKLSSASYAKHEKTIKDYQTAKSELQKSRKSKDHSKNAKNPDENKSGVDMEKY